MFALVFILVYLISFVIHLIWCYTENKYYMRKVRYLIYRIEFYMWCPILNTLLLIVAMVGLVAVKLWTSSKIVILREKFRNIKLK